MSYQVANLNIGSLTVGQSSKITFGSIIPPSTIDQQMRPSGNTAANLFLFNESGSGLKCLFPISGETFTVAAGQWRIVSVPPNEIQLTFTILYVLPNAPVTQLLADLYIPGETMDAIGVLGNSPIGLSAVSLPVTQVIQDGQPNGQIIVEATPTGQPQNVLITTDGMATLAGIIETMNAFLWVRSSIGATFPVILQANPAGGTINNIWGLVYSGSDGRLLIQDITGNKTAIQCQTGGVVGFNQGVGLVAGQATAGTYGVTTVAASVKQLNVSSSAAVAVINFTTPNDGINHRYRVGCTFWVGSGNTNNGTITVQASWTDPVSGSVLIVDFAGQGGASWTLLSGATIVKGSNNNPCISMEMEVKPNTTLQLAYQNSAAGTIADKVSGCIEVLA